MFSVANVPSYETIPNLNEHKLQDYARRIAVGKFEQWKMIETLALALNSQDNLRACVVSAGLLYGNGEKL